MVHALEVAPRTVKANELSEEVVLELREAEEPVQIEWEVVIN
jgi:hypothetical protein